MAVDGIYQKANIFLWHLRPTASWVSWTETSKSRSFLTAEVRVSAPIVTYLKVIPTEIPGFRWISLTPNLALNWPGSTILLNWIQRSSKVAHKPFTLPNRRRSSSQVHSFASPGKPRNGSFFFKVMANGRSTIANEMGFPWSRRHSLNKDTKSIEFPCSKREPSPRGRPCWSLQALAIPFPRRSWNGLPNF